MGWQDSTDGDGIPLAALCGRCGYRNGDHHIDGRCPASVPLLDWLGWRETRFAVEEPLPLLTEAARVRVRTLSRGGIYAVCVERWEHGEWGVPLTQTVDTEREARDLHRRAVQELKQHPELFD